MKPGKGKSKGSGFERLVCHKLSLWISKGEREDLYWRSAMSGGRATVMARKGSANTTQCGDISAVDPLGHPLTDKFLISCKFYRDLKIAGTVLGTSKGGLHAFWIECVGESKQFKKLPMLIAKQNNTAPFVCLDDAGLHYFNLKLSQAIVHLPIAGGCLMLWLDRFLELATRPGITVKVRPQILHR